MTAEGTAKRKNSRMFMNTSFEKETRVFSQDDEYFT